jgi:hypothetical protein
MGNCLPYLMFWRRSPVETVDAVVPRKVNINCACFNSRVVDDPSSSSSSNESKTVYEDAEEEFGECARVS